MMKQLVSLKNGPVGRFRQRSPFVRCEALSETLLQTNITFVTGCVQNRISEKKGLAAFTG
jgi:hypothetical protein